MHVVYKEHHKAVLRIRIRIVLESWSGSASKWKTWPGFISTSKWKTRSCRDSQWSHGGSPWNRERPPLFTLLTSTWNVIVYAPDQLSGQVHTLQRQFRLYIPFSGNCAASVPISTFMCLWAIYIFPGSVHIFPPAETAAPSWEYIIRSQTHQCENWDWGLDIPFLGIFASNFRHFFFAVHPLPPTSPLALYVLCGVSLRGVARRWCGKLQSSFISAHNSSTCQHSNDSNQLILLF